MNPFCPLLCPPLHTCQVTWPLFNSLQCFWPGMQLLIVPMTRFQPSIVGVPPLPPSLLLTTFSFELPDFLCEQGESDQAIETLRAFHTLWRHLGFHPEGFNLASMQVAKPPSLSSFSTDPYTPPYPRLCTPSRVLFRHPRSLAKSPSIPNRPLLSPLFQLQQGQLGYPLRPEHVESLFWAHRTTGGHEWLRAGVDVLHSLERLKLPCGYAAVGDIMNGERVGGAGGRLETGWESGREGWPGAKKRSRFPPLSRPRPSEGTLEDKMESFFLSETLKYLYLLFDPDDETYAHGKYVFTTEAHPLPLDMKSIGARPPQPLPTSPASFSLATASAYGRFGGEGGDAGGELASVEAMEVAAEVEQSLEE